MVAEQFATLEALHPDRIDLGIGRAPGTDQRTALALRRSIQGLSAEDFPAELSQLIMLLAGGEPADPAASHPGIPAASHPGVPIATGSYGRHPDIWLLGSSGYSAQLAGLLGLPFSFAHHFSAANTVPALALYRESFRPSAVLDRPHAMVAVNAVCAQTPMSAPAG